MLPRARSNPRGAALDRRVEQVGERVRRGGRIRPRRLGARRARRVLFGLFGRGFAIASRIWGESAGEERPPSRTGHAGLAVALTRGNAQYGAQFSHRNGGVSVMSESTKYLLPEDRIPKAWYNIAADLPAPLPPPLNPGTGQPIGPADLSAIFPMALIGQEVSAEREIEIPEPVREVYKLWRPAPLYPRAPPGTRARYAGAHLLQIRGRLAAGQPQAQHRGAAGLLQQGSRHQETVDRDRRRAVGLLARLRRGIVRARSQSLHGEGELQSEALPARADGNLRRHLHRQPERGNRLRQSHPRQDRRIRPAASASPFPRRSKSRPRTPTPITRSAACSTTC